MKEQTVNQPISKVFAYDGANVTFARKDSITMVNATEMAKSFGKVPKDWLRTKQSKGFIASLSAVRQISPTELVVVQQGNFSDYEQGTWMHEDVAMEFARWLAPEFAIWCNDRIKELLTVGMTATQPTLEAMLDNPDLIISLATKLKHQREENERLLSENKQQAEQVIALSHEIEAMQPKVSYYDTILNNKSTVLITQIAQDYGMSAKAFNKILSELGVQHKVNGQWILYAKYLGQGYVQSKPVEIAHKDGHTSVKYNTEWTQKGRLFLYQGLKNHNILPLIEQN